MQLYLIRHTSPAIPSGICYGQTDIDVADTFADDLAVVYSKIAHISPAISFCSPLKRCMKLAEQLNLQNLQTDKRLLELNFGAWEMRAWNDIPRQQLDRWSKAYVDAAPPNGETFTDLYNRAADFVTELQSLYQDQSVMVITHAGVIRGLLALVLNLPLTEVFKFELNYGSITQLKFNKSLASVGYINQ